MKKKMKYDFCYNQFNSEDVKNQCSHLNDLTMKLFGKQDRVLKVVFI